MDASNHTKGQETPGKAERYVLHLSGTEISWVHLDDGLSVLGVNADLLFAFALPSTRTDQQ